MLKTFAGGIFFGLLALLVLSQVAVAATPFPSPTQIAQVNSFELFWPISAGRTVGDSLYFLKSLKENVRGLLIFGDSQKADYMVFLATKRAVEAEKLIVEGRMDMAEKTLDKMTLHLEKGKAAIAASTQIPKDKIDQINQRLDNLEIFLLFLTTKGNAPVQKIEYVLEKVREVNRNI